MKHLTINNLIELSDGIIDKKKEEKYLEHLKTCKKCKHEYDLLQLVRVRSEEKINIAPSQLEMRIMKTYDIIYNEKNKFDFFKSFNLSSLEYKPIIAIIMVVLMIIITVFIIKPFKKESSFNYFTFNAGLKKIIINNKSKRKGKIFSNSIIETKETTNTELQFNSNTKIKIHKYTRLKIEKIVWNKNKNIYEMKFFITSGFIEGNFDKRKKIAYSFHTPHAEIFSGGTVFIIKVDAYKTKVIVTNGFVLVKNKKSKKTIIIRPGKTITVRSRKMNTKINNKPIKKYKYLKKFP